MLAMFVLLAVLVAAVNITGFAAAANDADRITREPPQGARSFTIGFDKEKKPVPGGENLSGLSDSDAQALAEKLRHEKSKCKG